MRIIRVLHRGVSFYARVTDGGLQCLDRAKGIEGIIPPEEATLLPLAVPSKIITIEARPTDSPQPTPRLNLKPPSSVIGNGQTISIPATAQQAVANPMLGILIGRQCRGVQTQDMPSHIFGYTCCANIAAHVPELAEPGSAAAQGFDTFTPVGPFIETDLPALEELDIALAVNDETSKHFTIDDLTMQPLEAISHVSSIMTLLPGDVVMFGVNNNGATIADGDVVSVEISGLGRLSNPVQAESAQSHSGGDTAAARVQ
ncbi:fumarylacetoacetate hydrolase family protein [Desulfobaculum sp. SPO524]|uniref:fumarylacetoacetate hydrolase family protein n=1 Tax=Desulfobaculum sp. SPO524 TaxID=3378071 RepID=UPI0038520832